MVEKGLQRWSKVLSSVSLKTVHKTFEYKLSKVKKSYFVNLVVV